MVKYSLIMPQRKWQRFPGSNRFYCNGLLMSANQIGILIFVAIVIVITAALFFAFDSVFLVRNIHPIGLGAIFPFIGALGMFYSLAFLFKTGCIDPGVVPRSNPDEIAYQSSLGDEDPTNTARGFVGTPARYKTVEVRGQQLKLKWCATCNIWRPPRASHCGLCNNCYECFDHHCPVVGNCVAKRNYRFFYLFLVTVTVMSLYVMGCNVAVVVVASRQMGFGEALKTYPASVIEFGISGLSLISVSGLAAMHTWLIARMETTNEDIKGTFNPRRQGRSVRNPYTQRNCCANFCTVICGPFPPSLLNRRGFVDESAVTIEEEAETGYGATSSVPKLPPEPQASASLDEMPPVTEQPQTTTTSTKTLDTPEQPRTAETNVSRSSSQTDDEKQQLIAQ